VCPRHCAIAPGALGFCRARTNRDGIVVDAHYGELTSIALDPVEKKPFAEWEPGSLILSIGGYGCNLSCPFCQNAGISQAGEGAVRTRFASPSDVVRKALGLRPYGNIGVAITYNEPFVSFDYLNDTARATHEAGLEFAVVTNGMVCAEAFSEVLPSIDAMNIDLKGFSSRYYAACGFDGFREVRASIAAAAACPTCHLEVTTLVVPGLVRDEEMEEAAAWLASLDPDIPYHITQYHPAWRYREPPLPRAKIDEYADRARRHLSRVYVGNV
jgi:pyruvate formate lyase activating enzyme